MAIDVIPLQQAVKVNIILQTLFASGRDFGLPLFVTSENTPGIDQLERVRRYASKAEVAVDWNSTDEAYIMAQTAFAQVPTPDEILIGVRFLTDQPGFIQLAPLASGVDLSTFTAVTDGSFQITIDGGTPGNVTGLDFSADLSLADVAATITTALTGATCAYDSALNRFILTSDLAGDTSAIDFLAPVSPATGTDISGAGFLNGQVGSQSRLVPGLTVGTVSDELDNILAANNEAYFIAFSRELRETLAIEDVMLYVESLFPQRQLFLTTNNPLALNGSYFADLASIAQGLGLNRTWVAYSGYHDEYPEVSTLSRAATVNFLGIDTSLSLIYKTLPGITPENASGVGAPAFNSNALAVANSKNLNVYSIMGSFPKIVTDAKMASGVYQDELHFSDWLANYMETNVFNILQSTPTKIPYTEPGLDRLQIGIVNSLEQGIRNGGLAPTVLDTGEFGPAYQIARVPVRDISPAVRASREYPGFSWLGYLSGAIHAVKPINGTLTVVLP